MLIALESRLSTKHQLSEDKRVQYEKECEKASKKMHENIPLIQEDELKNADINLRIDSLTLVDDKGENLAFSLTLHDGKKMNYWLMNYRFRCWRMQLFMQ